VRAEIGLVCLAVQYRVRESACGHGLRFTDSGSRLAARRTRPVGE